MYSGRSDIRTLPVKSLAEGASVSYDTEQGRKGPAAANVRVLS